MGEIDSIIYLHLTRGNTGYMKGYFNTNTVHAQ